MSKVNLYTIIINKSEIDRSDCDVTPIENRMFRVNSFDQVMGKLDRLSIDPSTCDTTTNEDGLLEVRYHFAFDISDSSRHILNSLYGSDEANRQRELTRGAVFARKQEAAKVERLKEKIKRLEADYIGHNEKHMSGRTNELETQILDVTTQLVEERAYISQIHSHWLVGRLVRWFKI